MAKRARIVGEVVYREGDGPNMTIPKGPAEITETALDVTISWPDGEARGSTAIPITDFKRYVAKKAILVLDAETA